MDSFTATIRQYSSMSEEDALYFRSFFREKAYPKNTLLLEEGQTAHEVFFVVQGALHQYFHSENGTEKTCNFAFEQTFITDLESFSRQTRSSSNIRALEPTTCLVTTCVELVQCLAELPPAAQFFNQVVEEIATRNIRRIQSFMAQSSEQQLESLTKEYPGIMQRVPQRYIAQYLGIAPESLSRIRKRMLQERKS